MAVYAYLRVSTVGQAEHGVGLESQRRQILGYAEEHGLEIAQWFTDEGISGAIKDDEDDTALARRRGLMAMLSVLRPGDVCIVACTSRLWRSDAARVLVRRELLKKGAQVVSVENPRFSLTAESPCDRFLDGVMELLDEMDRAQISAKLERGRAARAASGGRACARIPYGYKRHGDVVDVDAEEARQVRRMYSLAQTGANPGQICRALSADGYYNREGKPWACSSVRSILTNTFYRGDVQYAGQTYRGAHTPIVSRVQWGKVASQLAKHSKGKAAAVSA